MSSIEPDLCCTVVSSIRQQTLQGSAAVADKPARRADASQQTAKFNSCSAVAEMGDRLATMDMGRKLGCVPLFGRGAGSPSSTMWPGPRPTSIPSGILIYPAVWPQEAWAKNYGGGLCSLFGEGELSPHLIQCRLYRGLPSYQVAS